MRKHCSRKSQLQLRNWLHNNWREKKGLLRLDEPTPNPVKLSELRQTEWVPEFEQYMRNRLLMGAFRYERMHDPTKGDYDILKDCRRRLGLYENDGNLEHLVDVANLCMIEFLHSRHPKKHFTATDDGEHCKKRGT